MRSLKRGILLLTMALLFTMPVVAQEGSDEAISTKEAKNLDGEIGDTSLTFTIGGKEITIDGIEKNENIENLAIILGELTGHFKSAIPEGQPEPKKPAWWIGLVLGVGASFNKILVSSTKGLKILKSMFGDSDTRTIVIGIGMALAFIYQLYTVGWKPFDVDYQAWAAMSFAFSALSMVLHEVIKKITGKTDVATS